MHGRDVYRYESKGKKYGGLMVYEPCEDEVVMSADVRVGTDELRETESDEWHIESLRAYDALRYRDRVVEHTA